MHVAKVNKIKNTFDNTFKNLRGRKVILKNNLYTEAYLVIISENGQT